MNVGMNMGMNPRMNLRMNIRIASQKWNSCTNWSTTSPKFRLLCILHWYTQSLRLDRVTFKISRRPPKLRRVPWGLPPVTLFSTWNINSALLQISILPPLWAFKQSYFSSTCSTLQYSHVIFENDVVFRKIDLVICHLKSWS
jgi:hypothetical protein